MNNNYSIVDLFDQSLITTNNDLFIDYVEVGVDHLLEDNTILEQIPIIKTVVSLGKIVYNIRDKMFCSRTIAFLKEFNDGSIDRQKIDEHKNKLKNQKVFNKEMETVLMYIDKSISDVHSIIIAKFYRKYINEEISWEIFCDLAEANNRMFASDYDLLKVIGSMKKITRINGNQEASINRLLGLGLVIDQRNHSNSGIYIGGREEDSVVLTKFGFIFYSIAYPK